MAQVKLLIDVKTVIQDIFLKDFLFILLECYFCHQMPVTSLEYILNQLLMNFLQVNCLFTACVTEKNPLCL